MLRNLQIWHLLWLALTPVLFALFRLTSEQHDASRALLDNLVVLGAAGWTSCVAVYFVRTGRRSETLPDLLKLYRGLLGARWFLLVSNLLGTALVLLIGWQLAMYRQVEFLSPIDVELVLNDSPGQLEFLGFVRTKTPTAYRLRVGAHKLVFRETATTRVVGQIALDVPSLLAQPSRVQTLIAYRKGTDYEKTE